MNESRPAPSSTEATIRPTAVIGAPYRQLLDGTAGADGPPPRIGSGVWIGDYAVVGTGVVIGDGSVIDTHSCVESQVSIGRGTLLTHRARVCYGAQIGDDCIIGGFVGDNTRIGDRSRFFGQAVHGQLDPTRPWDADDSQEPAAVLLSDTFVGFGAVVVGAVTVGPRAYVAANAVVTRSVPPGFIVTGRNRLTHHSRWRGALGASPLFAGAPEETGDGWTST